MHNSMIIELHCCQLAISTGLSIHIREYKKDPGMVTLPQNFSF